MKLRRLCFYRRVSVHRGWVSAPRGSVPGECLLWGVSAPRGSAPVGGVCSRGVSAPGGSAPGGSALPPPGRDGYCCGRYASYWNAFLFICISGKYYVKIGHREAYRVPLHSVHEMPQWYRHAHSGITGRTEQLLKNMLHAYLPGSVYNAIHKATVLTVPGHSMICLVLFNCSTVPSLKP